MTGPRDRVRQRRRQGVDVTGRRRVSEREPQRRSSLSFATAHGQQDVAGLYACRAGGTGRAVDAGRVEQKEQGVGGTAREADVDNAWQCVGRICRSVDYGVRYGSKDFHDQQRAEFPDARFLPA